MQSRAGETFDFLLRASDKGINISESNSLKITLKLDDEAPEIQFNTPDKNLVEGQLSTLSLTIRDNISVAKYSIDLVDNESREVLSETGLDKKDISITNTDVIDLSRYNPLPLEGMKFSIIAHAEDSSGNKTKETLQISLMPDQPPIVKVISRFPVSNLTYGATQYTRLEVTDDYVTSDNPNQLSVLYTSLKGLDDINKRNLLNDIIVTPSDELNRFSFNYPEAGNLSGSLQVNELDYWLFTKDKSELLANQISDVESLQFSVDGYTVSYLIDVYSAICVPHNTCNTKSLQQI
ncbi:hypothetical protein L3081_19905 [Colwellia sp. MSW7]|uniref:Ig-like domain-containing protein n=1 Tax=Colwellia maritima TaxID=2912588 RepID=A0ABS9X4R7_9GAMM|nr:hypothetical protein [Colwellia maritima]MCI2285223.1 hypothetical protein [Colwellia maritima]